MTLRGRQKRERRRHPRAITSFSATLVAAGRPFLARIMNLSMGGALLDLGVVTVEPSIAVGDPLSLEIRCRGGAGPLELRARAVLWNNSKPHQPLLAVQFSDDLSEESSQILEDLMFEALSELRGRSHMTLH